MARKIYVPLDHLDEGTQDLLLRRRLQNEHARQHSLAMSGDREALKRRKEVWANIQAIDSSALNERDIEKKDAARKLGHNLLDADRQNELQDETDFISQLLDG